MRVMTKALVEIHVYYHSSVSHTRGVCRAS